VENETKETELRNYTPHTVTVIVDGETAIELPAEDVIIRCDEDDEVVNTVNIDGREYEIVRRIYGNPFVCDIADARAEIIADNEKMALPAEVEGVLYVVSFIAAQGMKKVGRTDFVTTLGRVMDPKDPKKFLGCTGFGTL
jgi:hypothetical protein